MNNTNNMRLQLYSRYSGGSMSVPVTKFSLRMYGSQKAVEQEQKRQESAGSFVIHPYSNFRFYWDFFTLILLLISMIIIPVAITFFNDEMRTDSGWIAFNLCLDFWFLSDIIMNFHTGIIVEYGDGDVVLDLPTIRSRYLRSWFVIDLISTLPVDYLLQLTSGSSASASASRAMKLVRFAKIISLLRLLRISRLIRYVHQWEHIVGMQYDLAVAAVRIFNLVCLMLLIGHWNGCLQFLIPMLHNYPADSWIVIDKLVGKPWAEQYSWSMFKAMSHMLCIGYGQQPPKNLMDLWMTMLSMVSGAVCFAMFIGHATALIQSMDSSKRQYKEKYMQVKEYMRFRRLPKTLRSKVYEYYENRFQGKMFDENGILSELSTNLREEVVNFNCRHLVASVPFFSNAESDFVTEVVQKLKYEVFQPKDVIVREGEIGKKMYFIQHGLVEVKNSHRSEPIKQLSDGSYFGEICLLINDRRVASVEAVSYCSTYSLHVNDFNYLLSEHPVMRKTLERVAAARLSSLGRHNPVLEEKVKESTNGYSKSNEIAEEIVRHDTQLLTEKAAYLGSSCNRLNFRERTSSNASCNRLSVRERASHCNESPSRRIKTSVSLGTDMSHFASGLFPSSSKRQRHRTANKEEEITDIEMTNDIEKCDDILEVTCKEPESPRSKSPRPFRKPKFLQNLTLQRSKLYESTIKGKDSVIESFLNNVTRPRSKQQCLSSNGCSSPHISTARRSAATEERSFVEPTITIVNVEQSNDENDNCDANGTSHNKKIVLSKADVQCTDPLNNVLKLPDLNNTPKQSDNKTCLLGERCPKDIESRCEHMIDEII
uniref:potassium/sodium hyperpolarization-activated cyclic nucleotide-gated channel 3-like isoform X2 n=1 Tax=Ciona intestinalis TaxID=7719 RepID=UPI000EF50B93|nr:potassium/sodium hyperpolarization-activated cyclic nucleotide-gated channel 3-like isoform X2 [Ciona intestinalis]|eukprot:XP_026692280.1 potassium/sodium hyperpolarization-activated cyclic nucleotide-gated channel 3-like isoform X2 [Ciona intestinalis]